MKACVLAVAGLVAVSGMAANLVANFDHSQARGLDITAGWEKHIKDRLRTTLDVVPLGEGAIRFVSRGETYAFYEQRGLTLVPGAKYRLSFEVRNDDGSADVPKGFRQSLNYVSVKPYYTEASESAEDVAAVLGWTDDDRIRWPKPHQW